MTATFRAALVLSLFVALGVAVAGKTTPAKGSDGSQTAPHRVVIEVNIDGPERWEPILNNVDNLQKSFGAKQIQIEVVAHSKGIGLLMAADQSLKGRLQAEHDAGVIFAACENTMRKQNVTKEMLLPFVITVDSGVAELVRKQGDGWAYLKGGG